MSNFANRITAAINDIKTSIPSDDTSGTPGEGGSSTGAGLPTVTTADNNKVLTVLNGIWSKAKIPTDTTLSVSGTPADAKAVGDSIPDSLADLTGDSTHRTVTDAEKSTWNAKSNFSGNYNDLTNKPTIDSALSDSSTNAVQNKVIKAALDNLAASGGGSGTGSGVIMDTALSDSSTNPVQNKVITSKINELLTSLDSKVPTTRKVNNKELSADIALTAADVSAVPTTRKVNSKELSSDITLTAADVSAVSTDKYQTYLLASEPGGALVWDGNCEGKETILLGGDDEIEAKLVHISDEYPSILSTFLAQGETEIPIMTQLSTLNGALIEEGPFPIQSDGLVYISDAPYFLIIPNDGYSLEGLIFNKGIYMILVNFLSEGITIPYFHIGALKILGYNFKNSNDTNTTIITSPTTIFDGTVTLDESLYGEAVGATKLLEVGKTYLATINENKYFAKAETLNGINIIGNPSISDSTLTNNEKPYLIGVVGNGIMCQMQEGVAGEINLKVEQIPGEVVYDGNVSYLGSSSTSTSPIIYSYAENIDTNLITENAIYTFILNNIQYSAKAKAFTDPTTSVTYYYLGNLGIGDSGYPDSGESYCIATIQNTLDDGTTEYIMLCLTDYSADFIPLTLVETEIPDDIEFVVNATLSIDEEIEASGALLYRTDKTYDEIFVACNNGKNPVRLNATIPANTLSEGQPELSYEFKLEGNWLGQLIGSQVLVFSARAFFLEQVIILHGIMTQEDPTLFMLSLEDLFFVCPRQDQILPYYSSSNEGQVLKIVSGSPAWTAIPNAEEVAF